MKIGNQVHRDLLTKTWTTCMQASVQVEMHACVKGQTVVRAKERERERNEVTKHEGKRDMKQKKVCVEGDKT